MSNPKLSAVLGQQKPNHMQKQMRTMEPTSSYDCESSFNKHMINITFNQAATTTAQHWERGAVELNSYKISH